MIAKTRYMSNWFVIRVPYLTLILMLIFFVTSGAPSFHNDNIYQITAAVVVVLQILSITIPKIKTIVIIADLSTIFWLIMIAWEIYTHLYPNKAGLFAIMQAPTLAIFVAFGSPLRSKIYSKKIVIKTSHYGENLSPHFSNVS